jgi:Holliday junction resolvasome RuvABC endonuclease subunit
MTTLDIGVDCSTHHISMGILSSEHRHAEVWEVGANPRGSKAADRFVPLMQDVIGVVRDLGDHDELRVYIEDVPYVAHGKVPVNKAALIDLAQVTGGVASAFIQREAFRPTTVVFVNNQSWKAHFGFGHSDVKGQIASYVELAWLRNISAGVRHYISGLWVVDSETISQDLSDALCIAEYGRSLRVAHA